MVEASVSEYGLGLRWSTWLQWRRAWSVIRKNPWLRSEPLSASEVIRLAEEVKKAEAPFPADAHDLQTFWEHRRATKAEERAETLQDLRHALHETRIEADVLRQELAAARKQVEDLAARAAEAERDLTETRASLEAMQAESRWVHVLRAMGLR
jgi:chromosome segregation ATPase